MRRLLLAALAALAFAAPAAADVHVAGIDTSSYPELRVDVVVPLGTPRPRLYENGSPVAGLQAANLGHAKSVVLAVDRSRSMRGQSLRDAAAAALSFVGDKAGADRIAVVTFGHTAVGMTRFSAAATDAEGALADLRSDDSVGTALWDAVVLAARKLAREDQPGHVIVVLTDGHDVSSTATMRDAIAAAHDARASVYPIAIAGPDFTPTPLRELASATGGSYHQAASSSELAAIYASISRRLARTWELRYPTAARPGDRLTLTATAPGAGKGSRDVALATRGATAAAAAPSPVLPKSAWRSPVAPLALSALVAFLVLLACCFWFAARQGRWVRSRLEPHLGAVKRDAKERRRTERKRMRRRVTDATDSAFANVRHFRSLQRLIERADLPLRAGELLYIGLGASIVAGLFAAVTISAPLAILIAMAGGAGSPVLFVAYKAKSRVKAFDNQLPDLLITIAASLKAGHSFRQGIQAVVDEGADPAAKEFKRVLTETRLGRPMDDALTEMATRVGSRNLSFVMTAVTIQRQIGGSLAGLFDMVAETVRQRQQFAAKVRGLTAMGRMSSYVLIGLPFFIGITVTLMNPKYMSPLYHTSTGQKLIVFGLVMMAFGTLILKKIVSFRG